jgi:hypothetical protein
LRPPAGGGASIQSGLVLLAELNHVTLVATVPVSTLVAPPPLPVKLTPPLPAPTPPGLAAQL